MKIRFDKIGYPLYCDAGPFEGDMRIDLNIRLYLSPKEYASYEGFASLQITLTENGDGRPQVGSTAEPSGELSGGDVVAIGEAALAVARPGRGPRPRARNPPPARTGPARPPPCEPPDRFPRKEPNRP